MPTDRIFKFTIPGVMFFLSFLFFDYFFGLSFLLSFFKCISLKNSDSVVTIVALITSTPIVGLVVSTVGLRILHLPFIMGYGVHYYIPKEIEIIKNILINQTNQNIKINRTNAKTILKGNQEDSNEIVWTNEKKELFFPYYQVMVRRHIKDDALGFLERRWSTFWTQTNNLFAILFSFLACAILKLFSPCTGYDLGLYKGFGLFIILVYSLSAWHNLWKSRKEAGEFERISLENAIGRDLKKEEKKSVKEKKSRKP